MRFNPSFQEAFEQPPRRREEQRDAESVREHSRGYQQSTAHEYEDTVEERSRGKDAHLDLLAELAEHGEPLQLGKDRTSESREQHDRQRYPPIRHVGDLQKERQLNYRYDGEQNNKLE